MKTDLEIANNATSIHIKDIAKKLNIAEQDLEFYGSNKAKLPLDLIDEEKIKENKLILVTAMTPTPLGEGKTTTSISLAQGINKLNEQATVVLREPSLGPVFGIKGGAAGGGYSQVVPMEDINLHFTGDFSAVEKANNLLSALIDNNIQSTKGNLNIDPRTVVFKRVMDMNDRALRNIIVGMGGKSGGQLRQSGFNITAASEVMAILCLSSSLADLKEKLANIYVGDTYEGTAIYARDLNAQDAMTILLKDAIKPNLVQTLENTPAIIHGGPFANIAQGTNSLLATKLSLSLSKYTITEAGFGSDLGAEKFFNIKCAYGKLDVAATVLVATIRAIKYHGNQDLKTIQEENIPAVKKGLENLAKHIENLTNFNTNILVNINHFATDSDAEINEVVQFLKSKNIEYAINYGFLKGGEGAIDAAEKLIALANKPKDINYTYNWNISCEEKIKEVATKIYGASSVEFSIQAKKQLKKIKDLNLDNLPICIAKTQKSFSDKDNLKGRADGFILNIRDIEIASGAGFIIPIAGFILRMPGLPAIPATNAMTIDNQGNIANLS